MFNKCELQLTEFDAESDYEGMDLRGNDVAALLSIANLRRATSASPKPERWRVIELGRDVLVVGEVVVAP